MPVAAFALVGLPSRPFNVGEFRMSSSVMDARSGHGRKIRGNIMDARADGRKITFRTPKGDTHLQQPRQGPASAEAQIKVIQFTLPWCVPFCPFLLRLVGLHGPR